MIINEILSKFRAMSPTKREQGNLFEKFVRLFLLNSKLYPTIQKVWLWSDFPFRSTKTDTGIDLVAQLDNNEYWAIQCKFYEEGSQIAKADIDSFLSASSMTFIDDSGVSRQYAYRLVVATVGISSNAQETLEKQFVPAGFLNTEDFDTAGIDWDKFWNEFDSNVVSGNSDEITADVQTVAKQLREHQQAALNDVIRGFQTSDRGKLIMACGTGKTYTALKIAEAFAEMNTDAQQAEQTSQANETNSESQSSSPSNAPSRDLFVLYLVPSLSLLAQTLKAWTVDANCVLRPLIVCSDNEIHQQDSRRKKSINDDIITGSSTDLAQPATTNAKELFERYKRIQGNNQSDSGQSMTVVFSTYQSIQVIADAQNNPQFPLPAFDLIICDEAHRTTGVTLSGKDESYFVKVHNNSFIQGKKRLYMTATPRVYGDAAKKSAKDKDADSVLCSMDDEFLYGPTFHRLGFGQAVDKELLTDYRVIILTINEEYTRRMSSALSLGISDSDTRREDGEIQIDDISKILGCWSGLCKHSKYILPDGTMTSDFSFDPTPMKRAVAFCSTIASSRDLITPAFERITAKAASSDETSGSIRVEMRHIDGTFGANQRKELLDWIKDEPEQDTCRILSNVRCLSEGVDVPSLDAVLFLSPRNSQVDVIQSLGRVMRKSPNKKYGYIILPIAIPEGKRADEVLNDNKRYKVVWEVLQALRAHDERFNVWINQLKFNDKVDPQKNKGLFGTPDGLKNDNQQTVVDESHQLRLNLEFQEVQKNITARVVQKCGQKDYLEEWAKEIALIATSQIGQIQDKLSHPTPEQKAAFDEFTRRLQLEINPAVDDDQAIEMLTQHIVTKPVFDALFSNYSFVKNNVVSKAIQKVLDVFQPQETEEQRQRVEDFQKEIKYKVEGINSIQGKQQVIIKLYDQFFKTAFPKIAEKLGIVYTPIEVVDFIIQSVECVLKKHFRRRLSNKTVHVLDPFTGTGTFLVRLLQSGLIDKQDFQRKYRSELHANEIVLLAYYIAAINIEETIHSELCKIDSREELEYESFPGIVLTDTFQMNERPLPEDTNLFGEENPLADNNERILRQRRRVIEVVIGNPPYSVGQNSSNDNNQNQKYPKLDKRVEETYVVHSTATSKKALYDSYIKAFRWASDRIDKSGIVAFVTNGAFIDKNTMNGFRKCLTDEFDKIYVFNLRGAIRGRTGADAKKEGQNVFDIMTGVAITILVKTNSSPRLSPCDLFYYDIGGGLNGGGLKREEKLAIIKNLKNIDNVPWTKIVPDEHGDWINKRNDDFAEYIPLGAKKGDDPITFFEDCYSLGVATGRDSWCYNFSTEKANDNIKKMLAFYHEQLSNYLQNKKNKLDLELEDIIDTDSTKISWTRGLKNSLQKEKSFVFDCAHNRRALYRPFCPQFLYFDKNFNDMVYQIPKLFPTPKTPNIVIGVESPGARRPFSVIASNTIPDLHVMEATQCFPLYYYEPVGESSSSLMGAEDKAQTVVDGYVRHDAITDEILAKFQEKYTINDPKTLTKEDIFYYVYGLLHSKEYRERFAADLKKMLPRLPLVKNYSIFLEFSQAGRKLTQLHLNYESPEKLKATLKKISDNQTRYNWVATKVTNLNVHETDEKTLYCVNKMRFDMPGKNPDKTKIVYNSYLTIEDIPLEAYNYIVNGKSALEWIMDRYDVTTHKDSGIVNNPNLWNEGKTPRYIVDLIQSVVTVSVNTMKIINALPTLEENL